MMSSDKRTPISRARQKIEKRRKSRRAQRRRLRLESLERRDLLTTFVVDTVADVIDVDDGVTSIREALLYANFGYGADEIRFDYTLEGETIRLDGTPLTVIDNVTIRGPGSEGIAISGSDLSSVLVVQANRSLTIENLTIRDAEVVKAADEREMAMVFTGHRHFRH